MITRLRNLVIYVVINILAAGSVASSFAATAQAAASTGTRTTLNCSATNVPTDTSVDVGEVKTIAATDEDTPRNIPQDAITASATTYISDQQVANMAFPESIKERLATFGERTTGGWNVCTDQRNQILSVVPLSVTGSNYFDALQLVSPRIEFKNEDDYEAIMGEPCSKFTEAGVCDETKDANGKFLYFTDNFRGEANGQWDAPKVDARIVKFLVYLVTPKSQGGAGHEFIQVGKIIQDSQKDTAEFNNGNGSTTATASASPSDDSSTNSETSDTISAHYYDHDNPSNPNRLAQAVDITEIDDMRITTRITKRKRLGDNDVSYQYKSYPIKVAWQSDAGIAKASLPNVNNLFEGSLDNFKLSISQLLDQLGLDADFDLSGVEVHSLGDVANYLGKSLISQLLDGGNLDGWDLESTLDGFGRAYLAGQLGLPTGSLSEGDTVDEVLQNIGRVTAETNLKLPKGSLRGDTSSDVYSNMGRRYFEDTVFKVSEGTLVKGDGAPINNQNDFLERLGEGRIEARFKLPAQSTRVTTLEKFLGSSEKAKLTFTKDAADYIDESLGLEYGDGQLTKDTLHLTQDDFDSPTQRLLNGQISVERYKFLVGVRAFDNGIGNFSLKVPDHTSAWTDLTTTSINNSNSCPPTPNRSTLNLTGECISSIVHNSSIVSLLEKAGLLKKAQQVAQTISSNGTQGDLNIQDQARINAEAVINNILDPVAGYGQANPTYILPAEIESLLDIGVYTKPELKQDLTNAVAEVGGDIATYTTSFSLDATAVHSIYTYNKVNTLQDSWESRLNALTSTYTLNAGDNQSTDEIAKITGLDTTTATKVKSAYSFLDDLITGAGQDKDGLLNTIDLSRSSPASQALGLPANVVRVDDAGNLQTQPETDDQGRTLDPMLVNKDPVTSLIQGDTSVFSQVGTWLLASKFNTTMASKANMASHLLADVKPSVDKIASSLKKLGISEDSLLGNGVVQGDFYRIFLGNMNKETFARIGRDQLLQAAWNKSGGDKAVQNAANGVGNSSTSIQKTIDSVSNTIGSAIDSVTFYTDRFTALLTITDQIADKVKDTDKGIGDQLKDISNKNKGKNTIIDVVKAKNDDLQGLLKAVQSNSGEVRTLITKAQQLIDEITVGHALDFNQTPSAPGSNGKSLPVTVCWTQQMLRDAATKGTTKFKDVSITAAGCQIDSSLNLPSGSMKLWYTSGKPDYTYNAFTMAVGRADAGPTTPLTDKEAHDRGEKILQSRLVNAIAAYIPGFKKLGLTTEQIISLFKGDSTYKFTQIGGAILDKQLKWPTGTAQALIDPKCPTEMKGITNCRENVRLQAMAKLGMQQLNINFQLPLSFDLTAKGNVFTNYGKSTVSEQLGWSENSFTGTFQDAINQNSPITILNSLGLGDTPIAQRLLKISGQFADLQSKSSNLSESTNPLEIFNKVQQLANAASNSAYYTRMDTLNTIQDPSSIYNTLPKDISQLTDDKVDTLVQTAYLKYATTIQDLQNIASGKVDDPLNLSTAYRSSGNKDIDAILKPYVDELSSNTADYWNTKYRDGYRSQIISYTTKVAALPGSDTISFRDFITGKKIGDTPATAESISQKVGQGLKGKVADDVINRLLNKTDNTQLKTWVGAMRTFTASSQCPSGMSLGEVIAGSGNVGCNKQSLAQVGDLSKLLTSEDPADQTKRAFLYDHLLAQSFGTKLETQMDLDHGVIRNMIVNPAHAEQIAINVGINKVADKLFGTTNAVNNPRNVLKSAFLYGFYDYTTNNYSLTFHNDQAVAAFKLAVNALLVADVRDYGRRALNMTISDADAQGVVRGDIHSFEAIAAQRTVLSINKQLTDSAGGDPRAEPFKLSYNDISAALGLSPLPSSQTNTIYTHAQAQYIRDATTSACDPLTNNFGLDMNQTDCAKWQNASSLSDSELLKWEANGGKDPYGLAQNMEVMPVDYSVMVNKGITAVQDTNRSRQTAAQQRVQERIYDIAAFQIDHNIPIGFSHAMLHGNSASKAYMLGSYAFNALSLGKGVFSGFLNADEFGQLTTFAASGFKDTSHLSQSALTGINNWLTSQVQKMAGINLPSGTMAGFVGWASTGFSSKQFSSSTITQGPLACNGAAECKFSTITPVGTVLKNWGEEKLFSWSDKMLGFKSGSSFQIFTAGKAFYQAQQAYKAAQSLSAAINVLGQVGVINPDQAIVMKANADEAASSAASKMKQAEAAFITIVIDAAFSKEIGQAETALGLVPGTGAIAVEMLVNFIMGVPISPLSIALFIGINLFGVYKVDIDTRATADGYYPYRGGFGSYGHSGGSPYQYPSSLGYRTGEFDPTHDSDYKSGIKKAAQAKVEGLLQDILLFPTKGTTVKTINEPDGNKLWTSQVFTYDQNSLIDLTDLIHRNAPFDNPPDWGYGPIDRTADLSKGIKDGLAIPTEYRFGFFPSTVFWNEIHIRW